MGFQRPEGGWRFNFGGLKTNTAADEMPPTKYPYAKNVRYVKSLQTRPGYSILFGTSLLITTTCPLPSGEVNLAYSLDLGGLGGVPPLTWSLFSGTLPTGLSLNAAGHISGTPTLNETQNFVLQLADSLGHTVTKSCSLTIAADVLITTTCPLPDATTGTAYSQQFANSGGVAPFVWSIIAGALPTGLSMDSSGLVSGTPTASGVSTFTVRVTDSLGVTDQKSCQITTISNSALVFTDDFSGAATAHGSNDLGIKWTVFPRAPFDVNQTSVNITHDGDGTCLHFDYITGDGTCDAAIADMTFAVPAIKTTLEDSDQLAEGICVNDNSVGGSLTRTGPMVFSSGQWNGNSISAYWATFRPEAGSVILSRMNSAVNSSIGVAQTAALGDRITITAKDNGTSVRVRLFINGVQKDEFIDFSASRLSKTGTSMGWMGQFCSAPRFSKWSPMVCAIPI